VAGGAAKGSVNNPSDPGSWNRYAYVEGDPMNEYDPSGQYIEGPCMTWGNLSWACNPFGNVGPIPNTGTPGFDIFQFCVLNALQCLASQPQSSGSSVTVPPAYIECVTNVWSAEQTIQEDIKNIVEGATTVNDVLSLAANLTVSGSAAYTVAAAAIVTGAAATLPEAAAAGAAAFIVSYAVGKVAGVGEDFLVAAFQKFVNYAAPKILYSVANDQAKQCAKQFPVAQ